MCLDTMAFTILTVGAQPSKWLLVKNAKGSHFLEEDLLTHVAACKAGLCPCGNIIDRRAWICQCRCCTEKWSRLSARQLVSFHQNKGPWIFVLLIFSARILADLLGAISGLLLLSHLIIQHYVGQSRFGEIIPQTIIGG